MAYVNGKYVCDYCGNVMNQRVDGWKVGNNHATCPMCIQKQEFMKLQSKALKKQEKESSKVKHSSSSNFDITFWSVLKWLFCPIWGGIYLIVKGISNKHKLSLYVGIEFTLLTVIFGIVTSVLSELNTSIEPTYQIISSIFGVLFIINIVILVILYKSFNENE